MYIEEVGWESRTGIMWLWTGTGGGRALVNAVMNFWVSKKNEKFFDKLRDS
jgi:hypothetical protein